MDEPRDSRPDGPPGHGQVLRFRKAASVREPPSSVVVDGDSSGGTAEGFGGERSGAELFRIVWQALADILGTAAAATLLRRAAQPVAERWPELSELSIIRESLEYRYTLPPSWSDRAPEPPQALREVVRELWSLLVDLTGPVVVNRLSRIPELRDQGILPEHGENS